LRPTHCGCKSETPRQEELAHISYEYTRGAVTPDTKRYLGSLPFSLDIRPLGGHAAGPRLVIVHGTPTLNTLYWTEDRSDDFCLKMASTVGLKSGDVIAFGHTHKPWHRGGGFISSTREAWDAERRRWRAGYVLLELEGDAAEHVRTAYDLDAATAAVREAGLPD
jgi:hypothetical protein